MCDIPTRQTNKYYQRKITQIAQFIKMNQDFALKSETNDYYLLEDFNNVLKLIELGQTPEKYTTDASGFTTDGRQINIELKKRNQTLSGLTIIGTSSKTNKQYTADTIYIESHKIADLLLDYQCDDKIPLYINFLNDGYVVLYNITRLKHRPTKVAKRIWSELYQGFELAKRQELKLEDAWIYQRINNDTYKLVHKP